MVGVFTKFGQREKNKQINKSKCTNEKTNTKVYSNKSLINNYLSLLNTNRFYANTPKCNYGIVGSEKKLNRDNRKKYGNRQACA